MFQDSTGLLTFAPVELVRDTGHDVSVYCTKSGKGFSSKRINGLERNHADSAGSTNRERREVFDSSRRKIKKKIDESLTV